MRRGPSPIGEGSDILQAVCARCGTCRARRRSSPRTAAPVQCEVRVDMNNRISRLSPRVIGALDGLVGHLLALREAVGYDDLDLDGADRDIGGEPPPALDDEEDVARRWCIRRTLYRQQRSPNVAAMYTLGR